MSNHGVFNQLASQSLAIGVLNDNQATGHLKMDQKIGHLSDLNTKLDTFSGHTNNTTAIGDGSTQLRTVPLGYDRSNGKAVSFLTDADGHQQVDAVDVTAKLDTFAGAGNNNIGEGSSKLQIYNYGRDVSAGNFKPMVVNSSAEQIVALSAVDNAVLDTIATNTANINVNVGDVEVNTNDLEVLGATHSTLLTNIDSVLDTIKLDSAAIKTSVELLDNAVSGSELQVDIVSSALPSGGATAANQSTLIGHVDGVEGKLDTLETTLTAIETDQAALEVLHTATNSKLDTIDNVLDTIKTDSAAIKTAVEILDNTVSGSELQVDIVSSALPSGAATAANQSTLIGHVDGVEGKLDTLETTLTAIETDQAALEVLHTATNSKLDTIDSVLDNIKSDSAAIKTAVELLDNAISGSELQVDVVSAPTTTVTGTVTANLSATDNAVLDDIAQKIGDVETAVQLIDDIVKAEDAAHSSGDKGVMLLGVRQDSQADFGADGDYVPFSVDADGKLRVAAAAASGGATEAKQDVLETTLTAIETSVAALDNAVDGNYLNVNLNVAGSDVDGNSGNKSAASQRVVIATDDINMAAIKTATEASATDLAALEVLLTATNSKIDTFDAVLDASLVKQTNLETLITTLDGVQDNVLTKLGEVDAVLDNIKVDTEAVETAVEAIQTHTELTTVLMFDAETVNSGGDTHTSSAVEIIKSPANGLNFLVKSSSGSVDAGDFTVAFLVSGDNSSYSTLNPTFKQVANDGLFQQVRIADYVPKFIKMTITNSDFSANSDFTAHLFY